MKCEHETSQVIPIKNSIIIDGDEITLKVKDRCEHCKKILGIETKIYKVK